MAALVGGEDMRECADGADGAVSCSGMPGCVGGAEDTKGRLDSAVTDSSVEEASADVTPFHLVISGSPRARGRSAALAQEVAHDLTTSFPHDRVECRSLAGTRIAGCVGCDGCRATGICVINDDMTALMEALDKATELYLVSPVYFAGPPSQLKAVLDRLQPHYWRGTRRQPKRPCHLVVVGDGGDPHGFEPLVTICRSALAVAGFALVDVESHIGLSGTFADHAHMEIHTSRANANQEGEKNE